MKSKLIKLTDGSKLEVKVNFYTLYLVKMNGIDKKLDGRTEEDLTEEENVELAGKLIYVILRSNGLKVDEEEAMMLTPMDADSIREIFEEFEKRLNEYKKKNRQRSLLLQGRRNQRSNGYKLGRIYGLGEKDGNERRGILELRSRLF